MTVYKQITPFVLCSNKQVSIDFFERVLGFNCTFSSDNYAFLRRDNAAIRMVEVLSACDPEIAPNRQLIYIDVDDVDALYRDLKPELDKLAPDRVRAPFDTEYGQRELHVTDPDALLVMFGMPVRGG